MQQKNHRSISLLLFWKCFLLICLPLWTLPTFFKNKKNVKKTFFTFMPRTMFCSVRCNSKSSMIQRPRSSFRHFLTLDVPPVLLVLLVALGWSGRMDSALPGKHWFYRPFSGIAYYQCSLKILSILHFSAIHRSHCSIEITWSWFTVTQ